MESRGQKRNEKGENREKKTDRADIMGHNYNEFSDFYAGSDFWKINWIYGIIEGAFLACNDNDSCVSFSAGGSFMSGEIVEVSGEEGDGGLIGGNGLLKVLLS